MITIYCTIEQYILRPVRDCYCTIVFFTSQVATLKIFEQYVRKHVYYRVESVRLLKLKTEFFPTHTLSVTRSIFAYTNYIIAKIITRDIVSCISFIVTATDDAPLCDGGKSLFFFFFLTLLTDRPKSAVMLFEKYFDRSM